MAIRNWRESFIRRTTGPTCLLHVVVYDRASYDKVVASPTPGAGRLRQKQPTRADRILQIYESAPGDTRDQWKSRIDVARWVRQHLDGKGEDREARRYVLAVLKDKLDLRFVGSPDGTSEK